LRVLNLSDNTILKIENLEELVNLRILSLNKNQISEIKGLGSLIRLEELYINENPINDLNVLKDLSNLKLISIAGTMTHPDIIQDFKNSCDIIIIQGQNY